MAFQSACGPCLFWYLKCGHKLGNARQQPKGKKMVTQAPETKIVDVRRIACDGGEGALGHPRVWLQISSEQGWVECPYCDTKRVHKDFRDVV